jgi:hypothetical protein
MANSMLKLLLSGKFVIAILRRRNKRVSIVIMVNMQISRLHQEREGEEERRGEVSGS